MLRKQFTTHCLVTFIFHVTHPNLFRWSSAESHRSFIIHNPRHTVVLKKLDLSTRGTESLCITLFGVVQLNFAYCHSTREVADYSRILFGFPLAISLGNNSIEVEVQNNKVKKPGTLCLVSLILVCLKRILHYVRCFIPVVWTHKRGSSMSPIFQSQYPVAGVFRSSM